VTRATIVASFLCTLVCVSLPGCGAKQQVRDSSQRADRARHAQRTTPRYNAAKLRYLANFKANCATASRGASASSEYVQRLIEEASHGNTKALPELIAYLNRLAGAFEISLHQARRFGSPPNPDSSYGIAYFRDSEQVISAIRGLSKAVANVDAKGVGSSGKQLTAATQAVKTDGERYGMPMCRNHGANRSPLLEGPAI
jgi:hypothetical protein